MSAFLEATGPYRGHEIKKMSYAKCDLDDFFKMPYVASDTSSIVEHLTASCVALSRAGGAGEDEARLWLAENRSTGAGKVSEQAWRLLEKVLERAEASAGQTRCHRAAARKILSLDCTLPYWLAASYKRRNAAELIAVYHGVGALDDAANTALELLDAVLGQGKKCYATAPLQVDSPAVWLPYSVLDRLHLELDANRQNPIYDTVRILSLTQPAVDLLKISLLYHSTRLLTMSTSSNQYLSHKIEIPTILSCCPATLG